MIYNKNIDIEFSVKDEHVLDGQSKICNWLYNQLLDLCIKDYRDNNNKNKYISGRNLRDQVPEYKKINLFLSTVHSSPLKNTAIRLKESFQKFFKGECKYPIFRSWKNKWFSLLYDEPNKGFKITNKTIEISLGKDESHKNLHITGQLKETLKLNKNEKLKTFRLCKKGRQFYGVFTIEKADIIIPTAKPKTWVAIDPNHKNFFMAIDNEGKSTEFKKLGLIKVLDEKIDQIKSKRDKCKKKAKRRVTQKSGKVYYVPSKRWVRLNKALERAYQRRREQIKQACYTIAHSLAKKYEKVVIGDYVPDEKVADQKNKHRSMLNQTVIGKFRKITEWTCYKSGRQYHTQDEKNTTSDCCLCGDRWYKDPSIREFVCRKCGTKLNRDINSAVNIAKKSNLLSGSDYKDWDLSRPTYTAYWNLFTCSIIIVAGTEPQKGIVNELNEVGSSTSAGSTE